MQISTMPLWELAANYWKGKMDT